MTARDVDRAVEQIARRQHGAFADRQAQAAGATYRIRRRRLMTGRWIELDHNVYALPSNPGTWLRHGMAAVLAIDGAAASHTTAAALHGLAGFRRGRVHVVAPPSSKHVTHLATVHRSAWPRSTIVEGIPTVTVVDTLFQLAPMQDQERFLQVVDDAIVARRSLLPALFDRYVALNGRRLPGIKTIRAVLTARDDGVTPPASELERLLDRVLDGMRALPPRQRQAPLPGWEAGSARVDVLIPDWRLIIEADGRRWHTRVADFERDRWRDNVATTRGYDVLRFTHHQLTADRAASRALLAAYADRRRGAA